ncbi:MAG: hypothetical protein VYE40_00755 [Myxococcota bacterium]|nr:hypothetical protein [Myxococcota bacterium]
MIDLRRSKAMRLLREEGGSALTEFTMFLPVWIVLFAGIVNLGKFGYMSTSTQIEAQRDLWSKLIPLTAPDSKEAVHMTPLAAGIDTLSKNTPSKVQRAAYADVNSNVISGEGLVWGGAIELSGHWGESYERTIILETANISQLSQGPHKKPGDLIDDERAYPKIVVDDSLVDSDFKTDGVASIIASIVSASGGIHPIGAGIRYGMVTGEKVDHTFSIAGFGSVTSVSRYDAIVPPAPLTGTAADKLPFAINRLLAESDDNYAEMLNYTELEWGNASGDSFEFNQDPEKQGEDQAEQQCKDAGFSGANSRCEDCIDRGFATKSACDCADDPDCPPPNNP